MREIVFRTKLSEPLFRGLPGSGVYANCRVFAMFAAISELSSAQVATVGKMSIPELRGVPDSARHGGYIFALVLCPSLAA
ncbi:hypothetical protein [Tropicimonas sp. S265A]|uniref:hypothetical protein n=1 Tax=Tropicimonas sp. S265A TaxID=3415134 RepID=UPI003C7B5EDC